MGHRTRSQGDEGSSPRSHVENLGESVTERLQKCQTSRSEQFTKTSPEMLVNVGCSGQTEGLLEACILDPVNSC